MPLQHRAQPGLSKLGDAMASIRSMGEIQVPPLPEGAFAVLSRTVTLPEGTPIPAGAVDLGDGMVQLPRRGEVPAGAVAVPEGTVKIPAGATALPPGTAPLPGGGQGLLLQRPGRPVRPRRHPPAVTGWRDRRESET
ncbi:hypothetical protein [Streptomyces peucetius]|uniref:Uncharacterized protein n=1 Tax=Streptomyces peucetius TaxID=1950 RepID=A0ABY6I962_STRPE|nr:hypothetical protein [Streptomyces peucetius]UYQ63381.1 hypothetical protein OGH68_19205 [Streptomyces peucetius]